MVDSTKSELEELVVRATAFMPQKVITFSILNEDLIETSRNFRMALKDFRNSRKELMNHTGDDAAFDYAGSGSAIFDRVVAIVLEADQAVESTIDRTFTQLAFNQLAMNLNRELHEFYPFLELVDSYNSNVRDAEKMVIDTELLISHHRSFRGMPTWVFNVPDAAEMCRMMRDCAKELLPLIDVGEKLKAMIPAADDIVKIRARVGDHKLSDEDIATIENTSFLESLSEASVTFLWRDSNLFEFKSEMELMYLNFLKFCVDQIDTVINNFREYHQVLKDLETELHKWIEWAREFGKEFPMQDMS